jgi:hypothetical protein
MNFLPQGEPPEMTLGDLKNAQPSGKQQNYTIASPGRRKLEREESALRPQ